MKKNKAQEQNRNSRRLSLNRETVRLLNEPALLEFAKGGGGGTTISVTLTVESTSQMSIAPQC
jgi:hypothetical protein